MSAGYLFPPPPTPVGQGSRSGDPGLRKRMAQQEGAAWAFKSGKRRPPRTGLGFLEALSPFRSPTADPFMKMAPVTLNSWVVRPRAREQICGFRTASQSPFEPIKLPGLLGVSFHSFIEPLPKVISGHRWPPGSVLYVFSIYTSALLVSRPLQRVDLSD